MLEEISLIYFTSYLNVKNLSLTSNNNSDSKKKKTKYN